MIRRNIKKSENEEENVFWVTMSDMLLGLVMVFMTLFVLTITGFSQNKIQQQATQSEVAKQLKTELKKQNIQVNVDNLTGQVKIADLELFDVNSYNLSPRGKQFLDKFIPIYVNTIFSNQKLSDKIVNVVIEGHTDSQTFSGIPTKEGQFIKNMDLSLKRANSVAEYVFSTNYNKQYRDKLLKTVVAEGKSFTDPVLVNGKEDYAKSRRVELKLVVKDSDFKNFLMKKDSKN